MENYGGIRAHNYLHAHSIRRGVRTTNTACTQHFTNLYIYIYTFTIYIYIYCRYVYRIILIICVCFRSGDEFLRDVRPDRTNRAFLILSLLFYARALHIILCLNYTAVGRTRCGPALPSDKTYDRSTILTVCVS